MVCGRGEGQVPGCQAWVYHAVGLTEEGHEPLVTHEELETRLEPIRQDIHNLSLEVGVVKEDVSSCRWRWA